MNVEELKLSAIFQALKKNKVAQQASLGLAKQKEWKVLKQFVGELKQTLLEATFEVDSLAEIRRYKHLIRGMESVILLPELVNLVKEMEKDDKAEKLEKEQEAKRRKYNPGAIVRSAMDKVRKIK